MKLIFIFILICSTYEIYAQSKKEQIAFLRGQLEKLQKLQANENDFFNIRKIQIQNSNVEQNLRHSELTNLVLIKKQTLQKQNEENKLLEYEIIRLQKNLNSIKDSIKKSIENGPIKFLDSSLITLTNEEIIRLMNVKDEDLGEAFVNVDSPELKPNYAIIGKQLFQLNGKQYCLAVMGVTNPNSYHASAGTNYLACFEIVNEKWKLLHSPKNTEFVPSVGFGIPAWLDKFVQFGDQKIAVILEGGYTGQGMDFGSRAIYGLDNEKKFHLIYEGIISKNDSANKGTSLFMNIDKNMDVKFVGSSISPFFNLIETEKSHGKIVKTRTLIFNEATMKYE